MRSSLNDARLGKSRSLRFARQRRHQRHPEASFQNCKLCSTPLGRPTEILARRSPRATAEHPPTPRRANVGKGRIPIPSLWLLRRHLPFLRLNEGHPSAVQLSMKTKTFSPARMAAGMLFAAALALTSCVLPLPPPLPLPPLPPPLPLPLLPPPPPLFGYCSPGSYSSGYYSSGFYSPGCYYGRPYYRPHYSCW